MKTISNSDYNEKILNSNEKCLNYIEKPYKCECCRRARRQLRYDRPESNRRSTTVRHSPPARDLARPSERRFPQSRPDRRCEGANERRREDGYRLRRREAAARG